MPRLARRSAGEQAAARAQRLSDDLLVIEERTFVRIRGALNRDAKDARTAITKASARAKGDIDRMANDARLLRDLEALHEKALLSTLSDIESLMRRTGTMTVTAMRVELRLCERTLADRYAGTAKDACDDAAEVLDIGIRHAVDEYRKQVRPATAQFRTDAKKQILHAKRYGETPDRLTLRLLSPKPLSILGNSGRGIWHRSSTWMSSEARRLSVTLMNDVRITAMEAMNEAVSA